MKDVRTTSVHQFGDGLLVEVIGIGEHGDVATETIEFDPVEAESDAVAPREDLPSAYADAVRARLAEDGYSVVDEETNQLQ